MAMRESLRACIYTNHRRNGDTRGTDTTIDHAFAQAPHLSLTFSAFSLYHLAGHLRLLLLLLLHRSRRCRRRLDKGRAWRSRSRSRELSTFVVVVDVVLFRGHCTIMIESERARTICIRAAIPLNVPPCVLPAPEDTATLHSAEPQRL